MYGGCFVSCAGLSSTVAHCARCTVPGSRNPVKPRQYARKVGTMVRPLRITAFFDDGAYGWSESHYDMISIGLQEATARFGNTVLPTRVNMMASGPWLKFVRASFDDTWRDSSVDLVPPGPIGPLGDIVNNPLWANQYASTEYQTALLRAEGGPLYRKNIYISGVPYKDPTDVSTPQQDPIFVQAFLAYAGQLRGNYGFPIWRRDIQTFPYKAVTRIAADPVSGWQLTVPLHGFPNPVAPGTRLWCWNMRFLLQQPYGRGQNPNGAYAFSVIDPNTLLVPAFRFPLGSFFVSGQVQMQQKDVTPYSALYLERWTHRKRGRPFDAPRGRSRGRTRCGSKVS